MVVAGYGERVSSPFIMPHSVQLAKDLGILLARAVVVYQKAHCIATAVVLLKNHITFLLKKWQFHGFDNVRNVAGTVYFTLQNHQM